MSAPDDPLLVLQRQCRQAIACASLAGILSLTVFASQWHRPLDQAVRDANQMGANLRALDQEVGRIIRVNMMESNKVRGILERERRAASLHP